MNWGAPLKPMTAYQLVLALAWMAGMGMVGGGAVVYSDLTGRWPWLLWGFLAVLYLAGLLLMKRSKVPDGCKLCTKLEGQA